MVMLYMHLPEKKLNTGIAIPGPRGCGDQGSLGASVLKWMSMFAI